MHLAKAVEYIAPLSLKGSMYVVLPKHFQLRFDYQCSSAEFVIFIDLHSLHDRLFILMDLQQRPVSLCDAILAKNLGENAFRLTSAYHATPVKYKDLDRT
jgi:hypothetical protein